MRAVNLPSPGPRGQPNGNGGTGKPRSRSSIDLATAALTWLATWVAGNLLAAVVIGASGHAGDSTKPLWVNVVGAICLWLPMLLGLVYVSRTIGGGTFRGDYGFRFEPLDFIGIPVGVLSQLVLLRLIYWPLEQWWPSTFSRDKVEQTARDLSDTANSGWLVALLVAMVVVGAPIVEELMYRGLLQGAFIRRLSEPVGVLAVAAWFAVIHFQVIQYPGLFAFGLVLGICALRTGRLGMGIAAHMAFNATGLILVAGR